MNTYKMAEEGIRDKAQLKAMLTALNGANRALRLDECVAWMINGSRGDIYTWGDGKDFILVIGCHSVRAWTAMKKRLHFCRVTQDGDEEGCLRLDHLPDAEEAEAVRFAIGLRQTRPPEQADKLRAHWFEKEPV
jgi:hypothetical protein